MNPQNNYTAKLDNKKRITIRGATTDYYQVIEKEDGTIILSPRILVHPDDISKNSLKMMDKAIKNFKKNNSSEAVDIKELEKLIGAEKNAKNQTRNS